MQYELRAEYVEGAAPQDADAKVEVWHVTPGHGGTALCGRELDPGAATRSAEGIGTPGVNTCHSCGALYLRASPPNRAGPGGAGAPRGLCGHPVLPTAGPGVHQTWSPCPALRAGHGGQSHVPISRVGRGLGWIARGLSGLFRRFVGGPSWSGCQGVGLVLVVGVDPAHRSLRSARVNFQPNGRAVAL